MNLNILLQTKRLTLRQWEAADANALISIANQPYVNSWLPDWRNSKAWVKPWIEKVQRHYVIDNPMTNFLSWAIELTESGQIIGQINIGSDGFDGKEISIGYFIDENHCSCGYTTEASAALINHTFSAYGYDHIMAIVQPANKPSNAVVIKLGFSYISTKEHLADGQTQKLPFNYYRLNNII